MPLHQRATQNWVTLVRRLVGWRRPSRRSRRRQPRLVHVVWPESDEDVTGPVVGKPPVPQAPQVANPERPYTSRGRVPESWNKWDWNSFNSVHQRMEVFIWMNSEDLNEELEDTLRLLTEDQKAQFLHKGPADPDKALHGPSFIYAGRAQQIKGLRHRTMEDHDPRDILECQTCGYMNRGGRLYTGCRICRSKKFIDRTTGQIPTWDV